MPEIELSNEDFEKIEELLKLPFFKLPDVEFNGFQFLMKTKLQKLHKNLSYMKENVRKLEIEHIESGGVGLIEYLKNKIEDYQNVK